MNYVVTGGAGFIGSHLVRRLAESGHSVVVLDDLSTGRLDNLAGVDVEVVRADVAVDDLSSAMKGASCVFHLAALGSVPRSVTDPLRSHHAAATGTLRVLLAARAANVPRLVNSSSSSVYGDIARPPMKETMAVRPRSPYAVAKLAGEGYTRVFAELHGMETVSLRYFNVFGPMQDPDSPYAAAIPRFINAYRRRTPLTVYSDGKQSRDFTYVENVVEANILAAAAPRLRGEVLNVAAGEPRSVLDVLDALARLFGCRVEPTFAPDRPGDIRNSHADISAARSLIGYAPRVTFEDGLAKTVAWSSRGGAA